ncbi:beta/gamma crystallin-related protein [Actimicrobium sp. CCC2.4]|uniref:beta/gamma crystallin-related protein n=1 Tax=Actimicrobium sp. CCC2.4 TaxID=3048606 RepID=UPI002AC9C5FA|nr:beta/gamma crystallin-related protein [Actimicrobium sp. CCC2.4]MEB0135956.1 beta/gamma crystallin-related protein [Actimicrobium sp. CCC2.4]WPX32620.1 beta/gamma crystallin-related protein [Actimicrobium sp. CCC2.4]
MKSSLSFTVLLVLAGLSSGVARAGEINLFEQRDFGGRAVALRETTPSLSRFGFNDRASSIVVRGGRWEVCSDDDFNGFCAVLERGDYPRLDPRLNERISSVREVGHRRHEDNDERHDERWQRGWQQDRQQGQQDDSASVVLFSEEGLRGRSLPVAGDVGTLVDAGFNDAAASMVIRRGVWELCSDRDFRGQCRILGPGEYRRLEPALYRSITSMRIAQRDVPGAYVQRGSVELYTAPDFGGNRYVLNQDLDNFSNGGFNDRIASFAITGGQWEMCVDAGFRGRCVVFGPGRYANLGQLSNQLSSMRRVD